MKDVFLADNAAAMVPEEIANLMNEITDVCNDKPSGHVVTALWLTLLGGIMQARKCTPQQAMNHAQKITKWTKFGTRDEAIAAQSPPH